MNRTNLYRELVKFPGIREFLESSGTLQNLFSLLPNLSEPRKELYYNIYEKVGDTPVSVISLPNSNTLYVKRECDNAMGNNHYSRYWIIHLALAEAFGLIKVGESTILEITSGSSGIALSMACEKLGYKLKIIVPEKIPKGRIDAMTRDCTTIVKVPGYIGNCRNYFITEKNKANYYIPNHSEEKADLISFIFSRIAYEFIDKFGVVDNVILALGNGSSTYSVGKVFKQNNPNCKIFSFFPSIDKGRIVYGLYADNLSFRHISMIKNLSLVDKELYTDTISLQEAYDMFTEKFPVVKEWGHSTLYGISLASIIANSTKNASFFSIAYDKINRYYE